MTATPIGEIAGGVRVVAIVAAMALAGCVTERTKGELVRVPEGALAGAVPAGARGRSTAAVVPVVRPARAAAPPQTPPPPPAHRPLAAGRTLEEAARETFLESATTIEAEKATVTVPASYAGEASLLGTVVKEEGPGRRVAEGVATLTLRRLKVSARRIVLVAREGAGGDVQITARGGVRLRSDQPASVIEETGLRSLILTNDGSVPLR
jgi:hypothetical protein